MTKVKSEKNSINWLCNQDKIKDVLVALTPRELTVIKAVYLLSSTEEEEVGYYDKMVQHTNDQALGHAMNWINKQIEISKDDEQRRYLYFRAVRYN